MFRAFLQSQKSYSYLLIGNILVTIVIFLLFYNETGNDAPTYLGLADGILKGTYSYWSFQDYYIPDTFRNPGYPLFLAFIRIFTDSLFVIKIVQLLLYFISLKIFLSVLDILFNRVEIKNIFLIFLLPSIHVASYTPVIFPEVLVTFLVILIIWFDLKWKNENWQKFLILGLLYGFTFQVRPMILFIPFLFMVYKFLNNRAGFRLLNFVIMLSVFFTTMLPYAYWNKKNHGVFKITPMEGGGGLLHLGYWMFKMPDYYESRYWGNYCNREIIAFIDESERETNIARYNAEWDIIDSLCAPYLTSRDSIMMQLHESHPALFKSYNSAYIRKHEELLKEYAIKNISGDLLFYTKAKCYSAIRLWVTGLRMKEFEAASIPKKIYFLYPVAITLVTFLAAIIFIPIAFYRHRQQMSKLAWILIITIYVGIIHIPFTIQSRYTIPVRLELLMLIAVSLFLVFYAKPKRVEQ